MKLGQSIKKIREWRNYTQEYMAKELAISQQNYSKMEMDEIDFPVSRIDRIAQILKVPVTTLFNLDEQAIINSYNNNQEESSNATYIVNDKVMLDKFEKMYEARIQELKERIKAQNSEITHLRKILEQTLSN